MKPCRSFVVVLVTAPDLRTARRLAQSALRHRLAACVNLIPKLESHYWWRGRLEKGSEILMVLKTTRAKLASLEKHILAAHPYDTPEFVVLPLAGGAKRYLAWLSESVAGQAGTNLKVISCGWLVRGSTPSRGRRRVPRAGG